jgi:Domain of unknown function (DUF4951)
VVDGVPLIAAGTAGGAYTGYYAGRWIGQGLVGLIRLMNRGGSGGSSSGSGGNVHLIDPKDLPTPDGMSKASFGQDFIGWGDGAEGANARAKSITLEQIEAMEDAGLTPDMVKTWMDYYHQEFINKGRDVFAAREKLMNMIYNAMMAG